MPVSTTPGTTLATTMRLPQAAVATVTWTVTDPNGAVIAQGSQSPTGTMVNVSFVMPTNAVVPLDGSPYLLVATDGTTMASDTITLTSDIDTSYAHNGELAYIAGQNFVDTLVTDQPLANCNVTVTLIDGTVLYSANAISVSSPTRIGNGYAYQISAGVLNTNTAATYGTGTIVWDFLVEGATYRDQSIHMFFTVTPYSSTYLGAIRKLVDRARVGDANRYINITTADLANAMLRGMDAVIESPPMLTPFALDQTPISLRDYVIKAGAADLLRAQYLAEGMSAFDMQGEGVQLQVDRSQYLDALAQQLQNDLQGLAAAKKAWQAQGMPLGATLTPGVRPLGVLSLTTGLYSNIRTVGFNPSFGAYSFFGRWGGGLPIQYW